MQLGVGLRSGREASEPNPSFHWAGSGPYFGAWALPGPVILA